MLKKAYAERSVVSDGWISLDPADIGLIESVYKKNLREGEERLMLAVLESAVLDFPKVCPRTESSRKAPISVRGELASRERRRGAFHLREHLRDPRPTSRPYTQGFARLEGNKAQNVLSASPSARKSSEVNEERGQASSDPIEAAVAVEQRLMTHKIGTAAFAKHLVELRREAVATLKRFNMIAERLNLYEQYLVLNKNYDVRLAGPFLLIKGGKSADQTGTE